MPRDRRPVDDEPNSPDGGADDELRKVEELFGGAASPLSAGPEASSLPEENLEHHRYDGRLWEELTTASSSLRSLSGDDGAPGTFLKLLQDLFLSYFKSQPNLLPEDGVEPRHRRANRPFVERTLDDPETYKARATTSGDVAASGLAALAAGEKLLEEIKNRPSLGEFFDEAGKEPAEDAPNPDAEDESPGPQDGPDEGPDDAGEPDTGGGGQNSRPEAGEEPAPDLPGRDARRAVRAASSAGKEEADRVASALSGWGLSPADLKRVPLGERLELLKALSGPAMAQFVELVGRMRNLARGEAKDKVRERRDEIHSIETSGDLARLLPTELAALASGDEPRRLEAEARLLEGQSLSWRLETRREKKRGPVVAMIDCSGSMDGPKMEWATAVALGLVDLAAGRGGLPKRAAALVYFNAKVAAEIRFDPDEHDAKKLLQAATVAANGGTDYRPPINRALEICGESGYDGADLLLVTDALCSLGEDHVRRLLEEKERSGMKFYSVLIGHRSSGELERYSDRVFSLQDLAGSFASPGVAGEVFGML